jgi:hypothetical protein
MKIPFSKLLIFVVIALVAGCTSNDAQDEFEREAYRDAQGITETDFNGDVIGEPDPDDWRISPLYIGLAEVVSPAFPNPVQHGTTSRIEVELKGIPYTTRLELGFFDNRFAQRRWQEIDIYEDATEYNIASLSINTILFGSNASEARGTYRLILLDDNQRVITYGDITIE